MSYKLDNKNDILSVVSQDKDVNPSEELSIKMEQITDRSDRSLEKVAIRSTKNIYWEGFGKISKGINIVSKKNAEHWLKQNYCTELTPEEVAMAYGVKR